jgi:2-methylcitrate dehydratase PrpD
MEDILSLTRSLGEFVANLSPNRIPDEASRIARMGFIDCVGVMIAGRNERPTQILRDVLKPVSGDATLYFSGAPSAAPEAAWINGVAAHALDFDDVALSGHPSTVLVPAVLAEAESLDVSGRDMIVAYLAGYEIWAELIGREAEFHHGKGWHPTGIFGSIAAAAACASLRRLDTSQACHAIGLGASQSAGLMANFGSMTKPFHAGRSAHAGVMAARLAQAGFTASSDAIEHPQGFLNAVSPSGQVDRYRSAIGLGESWRITSEGLNIKRYPACYCTHRAIDGMIDLVNEHELRADDIEAITVSLSENYATILRNHQPRTGLAAKFSIEFTMASSVLAKRVGLGELTDEFVQRAEVKDLMGRVQVDPNTDYDPEQAGASIADQVTVSLKSGGSIMGKPIKWARGHAKNPLAENDIFGKFENCLEAGHSDIAATKLYARFTRMESESARALTGLN